MNIASQRGNSKDLFNTLQQKPKSVPVTSTQQTTMIPEGGAAASLRRATISQIGPQSNLKQAPPILESYSEQMFINYLLESVSTLGSTKEYFNAINSLFTLYAMDKLTEGVLDSLSRGDLREIKEIVKEFSSLLDSY